MDDISTPIGWNDEEKEIAFKPGARQDSEHHVLPAGRSVSGKSNELHVLIHGLLHRYSADELNLYPRHIAPVRRQGRRWCIKSKGKRGIYKRYSIFQSRRDTNFLEVPFTLYLDL